MVLLLVQLDHSLISHEGYLHNVIKIIDRQMLGSTDDVSNAPKYLQNQILLVILSM